MRWRLLAATVALSASALAAEPDKGKQADKSTENKDPPGLVHMTAEQQKTIGLKTEQAARQPITEPVHLPGAVGFDPGHVAILRPFAQARVVRLLVQPGDTVAAKRAVVEVEMPMLAELQQSLLTARASLRETAAGVAVASGSLERAVILARDGSLARAEADRRRLVLAQAVAAQETARAKLNTLETEVARLDPIGTTGLAGLRSPINGIVVSSLITPGEVIGAATEAVTVADLHTVLVMAQVPEADATKISVSDPAEITLAGDAGRRWEGRVSTLGAQLNPQARSLPARIQIANPDLTLRAGMYVDVLVTRALGRESVVVPADAVQSVADKRVVFTPEGGDRFQSREVEVGVERDRAVEIRRGLKQGEQVVTQGSFQLKALLQQSMLGGG